MAVLLATALVLSLAASAAADPRRDVVVEETFPDVDPCTGLAQTVTIRVTFSVHDHAGMTVAHGARTLATSGGYAGRGTSTFVANGQVEVFRFADQLVDGSGNRIRADGVFVLDLSRDLVKVDAFELRCIAS